MGELEDAVSSGVSRRTVTKAAAWAVPVIALAATVPQAAASVCTPVITFGAGSCKCPGGSTGIKFGYVLRLCATVGEGCAVTPGTTLTVTGIVNGSGKDVVPLAPFSYPIVIPIGQCSTDLIKFESTSSSQTLVISYTIGSAPQTPLQVPAPPDCANGECEPVAA